MRAAVPAAAKPWCADRAQAVGTNRLQKNRFMASGAPPLRPPGRKPTHMGRSCETAAKNSTLTIEARGHIDLLVVTTRVEAVAGQPSGGFFIGWGPDELSSLHE